MSVEEFLAALSACVSASGMNLEQLAEALGVSPENLDRLLSQKTSTLRFNVLLRAIDHLNCEIESAEVMTPNGILRLIEQFRATRADKITIERLAVLSKTSRENYFAILKNPKCDPQMRTVTSLADAAGCPLRIVQRELLPEQESRTTASPERKLQDLFAAFARTTDDVGAQPRANGTASAERTPHPTQPGSPHEPEAAADPRRTERSYQQEHERLMAVLQERDELRRALDAERERSNQNAENLARVTKERDELIRSLATERERAASAPTEDQFALVQDERDQLKHQVEVGTDETRRLRAALSDGQRKLSAAAQQLTQANATLSQVYDILLLTSKDPDDLIITLEFIVVNRDDVIKDLNDVRTALGTPRDYGRPPGDLVRSVIAAHAARASGWERTNQRLAYKLGAVRSAYKKLLAEHNELEIRNGMERAELELFRRLDRKPDAGDIRYLRDRAAKDAEPVVRHRAEFSRRHFED